MTTRILLLRHGQSTWNAQGRWQGWADPPLSDLGREQARNAAAHLRDVELDAVVASDLLRARQTAETLVAELGLDVAIEIVDGLRERDVGRFSGLTRAEIDERYPGLLEGEDGDPVEAAGGELLDVFVARILDALRQVAAGHPGGHVLAVSHGGVIRWLERHLGADVPDRTFNCSGRWLTVGGDRVEVGELVLPVDPDLTTAPPNH